jgi:hypothetical protein
MKSSSAPGARFWNKTNSEVLSHSVSMVIFVYKYEFYKSRSDPFYEQTVRSRFAPFTIQVKFY